VTLGESRQTQFIHPRCGLGGPNVCRPQLLAARVSSTLCTRLGGIARAWPGHTTFRGPPPVWARFAFQTVRGASQTTTPVPGSSGVVGPVAVWGETGSASAVVPSGFVSRLGFGTKVPFFGACRAVFFPLAVGSVGRLCGTPGRDFFAPFPSRFHPTRTAETQTFQKWLTLNTKKTASQTPSPSP